MVSKRVFFLSFVGVVGMVLLFMNIYHAYRCTHAAEHRDFSGNILDMKRRLRHLESKNMMNALVLHNLLKLVQIRLRDQEVKEIEEISSQGESEAIKVSLALAGAPDLYPAQFDMDPKYLDPTKLYDVFDHVMGQTSESLESSGLGSSTLGHVAENDKLDRCKQWQSIYRVVIGRTWGDLPLSIQKIWKEFGCDERLEGKLD